MDKKQFEQLVNKGIKALPKHILEKVDNAAIVIADNPTQDQLNRAKIKPGNLLLGLYEGVPKTAYGRGQGMSLPDKITIFQEPIESLAHNEDEIRQLVKNTVWHEVAHHFGFSEEGVRGMERK